MLKLLHMKMVAGLPFSKFLEILSVSYVLRGFTNKECMMQLECHCDTELDVSHLMSCF